MGSLARPLLIAMLVLIYASYAALGRDIFFNKVATANVDDPIGPYLHILRAIICSTTIVVVCMTSSVSWAFGKVPLIFAPFVALALASSLWADDADRAHVFHFAVVMAMLWIALPMLIHRIGLLKTVDVSLHVFAWVVILSALIAVLVPSIGVHSGADAAQAAHAGRWRGIFSHKNGLGPWAAFGSVLLFSHSWIASGSRAFWWVARVSALACLVFAGSATSVMMAFLLSAQVLFFHLLRRLPPLIVVLGTLVAVVLLVGIGYVAADLIFAALNRDASFTGRTPIWSLAWEFISEAPWFGHGYQSSGGIGFVTAINDKLHESILGPESGLLELLLDLGIFGYIFFFIPFFICMRNGFEWLDRVSLEERAAIEMLMMLLMTSLFQAITETAPILATGFDGVISFSAFFALMTLPKSPVSVQRSEARLAKSWIAERDELQRRRSV